MLFRPAVSRSFARRLRAPLALLTVLAGSALVPASPASASHVVSCPAPAPGKITCFATAQPAGAPPVLPDSSVAATTGQTPYTPADLSAAYQIPQSTTTATVAIVVAYDNPDVEANMDAYRTQFGLPACPAGTCFQVVNQAGATSPLPTGQEASWTTESDLDVQMVSAVCPTCHILLVEADTPNDVFTAVTTATTLGAKVVSMAWGTPDWPGERTYTSQYFSKRGVAYVAAAGDTGYRTFYPAASPNVVSVGATTLTPSTNSRGWDETVWNDQNGDATSSGCSEYSGRPAWQSELVPQSVCARRASVDVAAVGDPATGVAIYEGSWDVAGGTSASTPIIAAMYALAGTPNNYNYPSAYPYYHQSPASPVFNDVTQGSDLNIDQGCSPDVLCTAGTGWDGPSGVGTPIGVTGFTSVPAGELSIITPADQHSYIADKVALQVSATSTDPLVSISYTASQLPSGLGMGANGAISGSPTAVGTWHPQVVAHASSGQIIRTSFTWTVTRHTIVAVTTPTILGTVRRGYAVRVSAVSWHRDSASGPVIHPTVRYQWLADGKPITGATGSSWRIPTTARWIGEFLRTQVTARFAYSTEYARTTRRVGGVK